MSICLEMKKLKEYNIPYEGLPMKKFFSGHKKSLIIVATALVLAVVFSAVGITKPKNDDTDRLSTCSVPEGKVVAHGIDVSQHQGEIDFSKVKESGVDFVIIRAGNTGDGEDPCFASNYENAVAAGLDVGCYWYTYATDAQGAEKDAADVINIIKGKSFTYPVFYDFEYESLMNYKAFDENTAMIDAFCGALKSEGYYPGVYLSSSTYNSYVDSQVLGNKYDFWVAEYDDYDYSDNKFANSFSLWQYSDKGSVSGISGNVDLDVAYVDYPTITAKFKKEFRGSNKK